MMMMINFSIVVGVVYAFLLLMLYECMNKHSLNSTGVIHFPHDFILNAFIPLSEAIIVVIPSAKSHGFFLFHSFTFLLKK